MLRFIALCLVLLPAAHAAGQPAASDADQLLTLPEYRKGLSSLRGYFEKRGEDPSVAERYIADMQSAFPVGLGERVPVTKGVFDDFLRYQAAWARKTRDGKNPKVGAQGLGHEVARADELKAKFKANAEATSPRFYRAFQAAVQDVRGTRAGSALEFKGTSAVFFGDQVDNSYTHVDAGNEALEKGDDATAVQEADAALAANPANADALVLRAGAQYDRRNTVAAVTDAQSALVLDPTNQQAQAILSLSATTNPEAARIAMMNAAAGEAGLAHDGRPGTLPRLADEIDATPARADANPFAALAPLRAGPPSPTPAVGRILAVDMSVQAVDLAKSDPRGSEARFGRAVALDPGNASARGWYSTMANRTGDYGAALGSAERGLADNPNDALAYYNKAYALAGKGDKQGMIDALTQAARLDPAYQKALTQAQAPTMNPDDVMQLLFGNADNQYQPAEPTPRHKRDFKVMLMAGFVAAFFLVSGITLFFRPESRSPRVQI